MDVFEALASLGIALAIGLVIGFEREQSAPPDDPGGIATRIGGARTYPLVAQTGALSMLLAPVVGYAVVFVALAAIFGLVLVAYVDDVKHGRDRGLTSEVAFLLTFLLGALSTSRGIIEPLGQRAVLLIGTAVIITLILSIKPRLHALAQRATRDDVFATLKFLLVAVVVLPLLPNDTYGPLDVLNPFKIGLMVVLIAAIDFVGYVAVRALGAGRGLGLTGLLGGLASSTAVALSMAARARRDPELGPSCALATVTASTVMFPRVLVEVAVVHHPLLRDLAAPIAAMTLAGAAAAYLLYRRSRNVRTTEVLELGNPFELSSALKWGFLFTVVLFLSKLASEYFGRHGTYLAGVLAGATDVDAITLSMAALSKAGLATDIAVVTIILGVASNTLVKAGLASAVGGFPYGRRVLVALAGVLAAGGVALLARAV
jgi:uncharacterized membrane protein (DUF4010 family)